jgi:hypothetical protein
MKNKKCYTCQEIKFLSDFGKNKNKIDGLQDRCRECRKKFNQKNKIKLSFSQKDYRLLNQEDLKKRKKKFYLDNKENILQHQSVYRKDNKEKVKQSHKIYYQVNKKDISKKSLEYRLSHKKRIRERDLEYKKQKLKTDLNFKLKECLRNRVRIAIKKGKAGSAVKDLGCSVEELKIWLESQFEPGMSWKNYGFGIGKWNIDHIVPLCSFDLTKKEEFKKACHWFNLQPLWTIDNMFKIQSDIKYKKDKIQEGLLTHMR